MSYINNMMHPNKKKHFIWADAKLLINQPGDKMAKDPNSTGTYYSVYCGVGDGTFFWYRSKLSGMPNTHACSSIEDGIKQAEQEFAERYGQKK